MGRLVLLHMILTKDKVSLMMAELSTYILKADDKTLDFRLLLCDENRNVLYMF